jgi:hypothetical protein
MTDRYTKAVLTIIAVCLAWIALGGPSLVPSVAAQNTASDVVIVGWQDVNGKLWKLPVNSPAPFTDQRQGRRSVAVAPFPAD